MLQGAGKFLVVPLAVGMLGWLVVTHPSESVGVTGSFLGWAFSHPVPFSLGILVLAGLYLTPYFLQAGLAVGVLLLLANALLPGFSTLSLQSGLQSGLESGLGQVRQASSFGVPGFSQVPKALLEPEGRGSPAPWWELPKPAAQQQQQQQQQDGGNSIGQGLLRQMRELKATLQEQQQKNKKVEAAAGAGATGEAKVSDGGPGQTLLQKMRELKARLQEQQKKGKAVDEVVLAPAPPAAAPRADGGGLSSMAQKLRELKASLQQQRQQQGGQGGSGGEGQQ